MKQEVIIFYSMQSMRSSFKKLKMNFNVNNETHKNINDEVDEDELYEMDKLSLDEKKNYVRIRLKFNSNIYMI